LHYRQEEQQMVKMNILAPFSCPLALMSPYFVTEVLFGNYYEYFSICIEFHGLEAKLSIRG